MTGNGAKNSEVGQTALLAGLPLIAQSDQMKSPPLLIPNNKNNMGIGNIVQNQVPQFSP